MTGVFAIDQVTKNGFTSLVSNDNNYQYLLTTRPKALKSPLQQNLQKNVIKNS